jgi:hypothetical protein
MRLRRTKGTRYCIESKKRMINGDKKLKENKNKIAVVSIRNGLSLTETFLSILR